MYPVPTGCDVIHLLPHICNSAAYFSCVPVQQVVLKKGVCKEQPPVGSERQMFEISPHAIAPIF